MRELVGAFNQEKALVGAFSVIVKTSCGTDGSFYSTNNDQESVLVTTTTPEPDTDTEPEPRLEMEERSLTLTNCRMFRSIVWSRGTRGGEEPRHRGLINE